MCIGAPDINVPEPPAPPKPPEIPAPPGPPAPPAPGASGGAAEKQGVPENPDAGKKRKKRDRSSLRIPKKQDRGLNLPGSGGSGGKK